MNVRSALVGLSSVLAATGMMVACATETVTVDDPVDGSVEPVADASPDRVVPKDAAKDSTSPTDASKPDSTTVTDASPDSGDASIDKAGEPFDPAAPKAGDPCPPGIPVNSIVERRCDKCGTQKALCEAGNVVGMYGPCLNAKTDPTACLPGERKSVSCGLCGKSVKTCDNTCTYTESLCSGEVAGGCVPGTVKYLATCANPAEFRRQVCSATCGLSAAEPCAPRGPDGTITVSATAGGVVAYNATLDASQKLPLMDFPFYCPAVFSTTSTVAAYVELKNTTATPANVTLFNKDTALSVALAYYPGATVPANRAACSDHAGVDKITVTVPANGSVIVYVGLGNTTASAVKLEAKTNFVGTETPVAVDHTLAISQTVGGSVDQNLTFDETKFLAVSGSPNAPASYDGPNACPVTKFGVEAPYRYVRLTNSSATARTVNLLAADTVPDSYIAVYPSVPLSTARTACTASYNDDCNNVDYNACLDGVTVPANGSVVVYFGQVTEDGIYDTNTLQVTTAN